MARLLCPRILLLGLFAAALTLGLALAESPSPHGYLPRRHHRPSRPTSLDASSPNALQHIHPRGRRVPKGTAAQRYKTEPDIEAVRFTILDITNDTSLLEPGYLFFTVQGGYYAAKGPQIFDIYGNLVWYGLLGVTTQDFHVCDYLGSVGTHLCVHNWKPAKQIFNQNYELLDGQWASEKDSHEFNMLPGGYSFLTVGTHLKTRDISHYTGNPKGIVGDACMLEIDVKTLKTVFQWCYLDHLPIWATQLWPKVNGPMGQVNRSRSSFKAGKGIPHSFWDFSHINSADLADGDYVVSLRHHDQIIKFAGPHNKHGVKPGKVIWRLGGWGNDFDMQNFNFSRQHHVRFHSVTKEETVISIFNNAWEGTNPPTSDQSDGQIILINNRTMKAHLLHDYPHPSNALADSRGSMQILPNKNALVGFGRYPDLIEYSENGTILYHLRFSRFKPKKNKKFDYHNKDYSYRIVKQQWRGFPKQPPKMIAYSRDCATTKDSPLTAYVSWNGATEAVAYSFRVATTEDGPWVPAGTFDKTGFETQVHLHAVESHATKFTPWISVDVLDGNGTMLARHTQKVFVPKMAYKWDCDETGCNDPLPFKYTHDKSRSCEAEVTWLQIFFLAVFICFVEACSSLMGRIWGTNWGISTPPPGGIYQELREAAETNVDKMNTRVTSATEASSSWLGRTWRRVTGRRAGNALPPAPTLELGHKRTRAAQKRALPNGDMESKREPDNARQESTEDITSRQAPEEHQPRPNGNAP